MRTACMLGALALFALAGAASAGRVPPPTPEDARFTYFYTTNLGNDNHEIMKQRLTAHPADATKCAALCAGAIGATCKTWSFCWKAGTCSLMAALPDSISKDSKGKSTYNPKCVSGILNEDKKEEESGPAGSEDAGNDAISLQYSNECTMPIVAAVHYKDFDGEWVTGPWVALAPGQTKEVAKTRNTVFYSYANEKGDPECVKGCWDGEDTFEKVDARKFGFREQSMPDGIELGDDYTHVFDCGSKKKKL